MICGDDWQVDMDPPAVLCNDCARYKYRGPRAAGPVIIRGEWPWHACVTETKMSVISGSEIRHYTDATIKNADGACLDFEAKATAPKRERHITGWQSIIYALALLEFFMLVGLLLGAS